MVAISSTLVGAIVMPASQAISWYLILKTSNNNLYRSVCLVSVFYGVWALYNRYWAGLAQELGQYSMGTLAVASYCQSRTASLVGASLVLINYALPAYFVLIQWSARTLAETIKNDETAIVWACVFKLYFVSNLLLWPVVINKLYHATSHSYKRA